MDIIGNMTFIFGKFLILAFLLVVWASLWSVDKILWVCLTVGMILGGWWGWKKAMKEINGG